jgi:CBS domain-containing protein
MSVSNPLQKSGPWALDVETAAELMRENPLSVRDTASVHEAIAFLIDKEISGAPVIDEAGRPVGVLSRTDVLVYDREKVEHVPFPEHETGAPLPRRFWGSFQIEKVDDVPVRDLMTPLVYSVSTTAPVDSVIEQLVELPVHRLFVVDDTGVLVGVITSRDILRHLRRLGR